MFSHVVVGTNDLEKSKRFYDAVLGALGYAEFLRRIMRAGCASYCVFIAGRKVMYFGKDGAFIDDEFAGPQIAFIAG